MGLRLRAGDTRARESLGMSRNEQESVPAQPDWDRAHVSTGEGESLLLIHGERFTVALTVRFGNGPVDAVRLSFRLDPFEHRDRGDGLLF